jgi:hypothetical protein
LTSSGLGLTLRFDLVRKRILAAGLAVTAVFGQVLSASPALAATTSSPAVIQSLKNDTSPPLRNLQASPISPGGKGNQSHRPLRPGQSGTKLPTAPNSIQTSAGAAAMPSTTTNFEGINNIDGVLPPDTNGDIGPNNYVQWVNLHFEIFDRTGTALQAPKPGNALWSGFGAGTSASVCATTNQGDPVVRYDRMADRWIFTQFAFTVDRHNNLVPPFIQCFAVSTTGDPTATYYRYAWQISNVFFPDYPKLAVWPDAYYMTVNYFSGNTFVGGGALAFDRTKMLGGQAATAVGFGPLGARYGGLLASDLNGSILPPSGSPNYFGAIDTAVSPSGSTFQIWKFHVDFTTPANSTFGTASNTPDFNLTVDTYFWDMCGGLRSCIQQPGTSVGLDAIGDRLMNRLQYRRFADGHESLVANHTVGVGSANNQAAVRWYEIRNLSTTPTIYQQSTYAPSTDSRWMGSIAMDQAGDMALGYSLSSSSVSPSIRYTGRLSSDPLGSLPQGEATLIAGSGSQTSSFSRWGDYSMMAVDPTDDCTFWYTQEYYTTSSDRGWQTRVGAFKFSNCAPPLTISLVQASNIDASSAVITWQTSNPASSRVDYGATTSYGSLVTDGSSVRSHSLTLNGLTNNATYRFKVSSTDAFGQTSASADSGFTTFANLAANGGFESGAAGWSLAPQASIDSNPADAHSGNDSLQLVATGPYQATGQKVALTAGQIYSFSAFGRSSSSGGVFAVVERDANGNYVTEVDLVFAGNGSWIGVTTTFKPAANVVSATVYADDTAAGSFWFDDINLTPTTNLITNGGFELGTSGWKASTQATIDSNPADAHSGNNSLQLVATGPYQATGQKVAVTVGQTYSFSAFGRSSSSGGVFALVERDASGNYVTELDLVFAGNGSWIGVATSFKPAANAVSATVYADNTAAGSFWFDDINLTPTTNLITNGGFEVGTAGWKASSQATIDSNPADAHSGNNSLQLVATGPYQATGQKVAVTVGQTYTFNAFGRSKSSGGVFALVERDASGNYVTEVDLVFAGNGSWIGVATSLKPSTNVVSATVYADNTAAGSFWFDDISLTQN